MNQTELFIQALTGSLDTVIDWRCIHDKDKSVQAHTFRGTLSEHYQTLLDYNAQGWGIFCCINAMDGQGRELSNVEYIRTHVVDLDNPMSSHANYERAIATGASFAVQSSPNKYHVYWRVQPYTGNDFYSLQQRKFAQLYDGDKSIIDATRVMRVPGFNHCKGDPQPVTFIPLSGAVHTSESIQQMLSAVNIVEHISTRRPLGDPEMQAPSLEWLQFALDLIDPNNLDRSEWLSFTAAIKQAGWNHTDHDTLHGIWSKWCDRYALNDPGENEKLWKSINDTEVGWTSIERRSTVKAYMQFGNAQQQQQPQQQPTSKRDFSEILDAADCEEYFKNCFFVEREGRIFSQTGRFMNATQFNGKYGGKQFIITRDGKLTDEPWKAALRSTLWTVPKVDHVRFLPTHDPFEIVEDSLGRRGLNTYMPARIDAVEGDLSVFFEWLERILPVESDRVTLLEYMAHCVKYPGHKIPWAPMLQSTEGIGKTIFREVMQHALGDMYIYNPKAPELVKSGSTFNAWMRGKLMIMVDEIKIDERRELIEILKPMITDARVEIQSKGVDQDMEDNPANWFFFSNYKDAIPITKSGRRYAIFYSVLQPDVDLEAIGMGKEYFDRLWKWLREQGGLQAITHYLLNYPIERGGVPARAPKTSSYEEALNVSRSPLEATISDAVKDNCPGFRGGYVSTIAVIKKHKDSTGKTVNTHSVQRCLETMGYVPLGRADRAYMQEDLKNRAEIYGINADLDPNLFAMVQGYT